MTADVLTAGCAAWATMPVSSDTGLKRPGARWRPAVWFATWWSSSAYEVSCRVRVEVTRSSRWPPGERALLVGTSPQGPSGDGPKVGPPLLPSGVVQLARCGGRTRRSTGPGLPGVWETSATVHKAHGCVTFASRRCQETAGQGQPGGPNHIETAPNEGVQRHHPPCTRVRQRSRRTARRGSAKGLPGPGVRPPRRRRAVRRRRAGTRRQPRGHPRAPRRPARPCGAPGPARPAAAGPR